MQNLMHVLMTSSAVFFIFLLLTLLLTASSQKPTQIEQDRNALIAFIKDPNIKIPDGSKYSWHKSQNETCDLNGVTCSVGNFSVITLRLPAASLVGKIPPKTLGNITSLTVLSLHDNALSGPFPDDFDKLSQLSHVYLHNNNLSGEFPSSVVAQWTQLEKLDLSNNNFSGRLPDSLPPSLQLENFNVSNNNLSGPIPASLAKLPKTAISGNIELCGEPLPNPPGPPPPSPPKSGDKKKKKKLSSGEIVAIAIGSALILLILLICLGKRWSRAVKEKKATMAGTSSSSAFFVEDKRSKLVFFDRGDYSFDLEDLLRTSAEVLGKGSVGTSYKTVLKEGTTVVVKRLKDVVDASKTEFDVVMEGLGKMKNENVVSIRAYYYSKDEKFFVCDYFSAGSLSALLHGSRGSGRTHLDWDHRLRIALSAAKGVAYLHVAGKVVHGNIKSSNILLRQDSKKDASVSDFGLNTLFGGSSSSNTRANGYRAPEVLETRKVTVKSDVYSFGVLLLELLTGKAPNPTSLGEEGIDLPRWVKSVTRAEVFDVELMRYQNIEKEKDQLLQIAMACVSIVPDQRPAMQEVVRMMEDMNRAETDDGIV